MWKEIKNSPRKEGILYLHKGNRDELSENGLNKFLLNEQKNRHAVLLLLIFPALRQSPGVCSGLHSKALMLLGPEGEAAWEGGPAEDSRQRRDEAHPGEPALSSLTPRRRESSASWYRSARRLFSAWTNLSQAPALAAKTHHDHCQTN